MISFHHFLEKAKLEFYKIFAVWQVIFMRTLIVTLAKCYPFKKCQDFLWKKLIDSNTISLTVK